MAIKPQATRPIRPQRITISSVSPPYSVPISKVGSQGREAASALRRCQSGPSASAKTRSAPPMSKASTKPAVRARRASRRAAGSPASALRKPTRGAQAAPTAAITVSRISGFTSSSSRTR